MIERVGLLYRPGHEDSIGLSLALKGLFAERGVDVWRGPVTDDAALCAQAGGLDMLVTLGGDGTIVRAMRCVAPAGVPILGVNLGRLGFLAEVEPEDALSIVPRVLGGEYNIERRMMLHTVLVRDGEVLLEADAINDVVVGRGRESRSVQASVDVDGRYVMTQTADGLIVASPTGSTAYSLSAGGPIVTPGVRCMVITPIAAHLAVAHAMVVPCASRVCIRLLKGSDPTLSVDGQLDADIHLGDEVYTTASTTTAGFVRFGDEGHFYETVMRKLRWPDQRTDT